MSGLEMADTAFGFYGLVAGYATRVCDIIKPLGKARRAFMGCPMRLQPHQDLRPNESYHARKMRINSAIASIS